MTTEIKHIINFMQKNCNLNNDLLKIDLDKINLKGDVVKILDQCEKQKIISQKKYLISALSANNGQLQKELEKELELKFGKNNKLNYKHS